MRPVVALAFTLIGFVALTIAGVGILSLATDEDVVATPGTGLLPGAVALLVAAGGYAGSLWAAIRGGAPTLWTVPVVAAVVLLAYAGGVWFGVLLGGADPAAAVAAAGELIVRGFGFVAAVAAAVCAAAAVALVRRRGERPRWPWERR